MVVKNMWKKLGLLLLMIGGATFSFGQTLKMNIGSVTVDPLDLAGGGCVQVPITFTNTGVDPLVLESYQLTVKLTDPDGVLASGIAGDYLVANGFAGTPGAGITDPASALSNVLSGTAVPSCGVTFNQATEGGAEIDWTSGMASTVFVQNNAGGNGWKRATVINSGGTFTLGEIAAGETYMIGVVVLELDAIAGVTQLTIEATSVMEDPTGNAYVISAVPRIDELFDISEALGLVNIFNPPVCSGATAADDNGAASGSNIEINYEDIVAGGNGGAITLSIPTGTADRFVVDDGQGYSNTIASTPGTTTLSVDTDTDGTPVDTSNSTTYTITPEVEFPPASGTYVAGTPCTVTVTWAPTTCNFAFSPQPIIGMNSDMSGTVTNARWNGADYGTVTLPDLSTVALTAPSVAGNVLTFNNVVSLVNIQPTDAGTYDVDADGPGTNTADCPAIVALEPPVNMTSCASLTAAEIGSPLTITLAGNVGTIDFSVTYNGVTTSGISAGSFTTPNNVTAGATTILTRARGFDGTNEVFDDITCDLDYVAPTCVATQDPDSTVTPVDVGTVIELRLTTTGVATAPQITGSGPMTLSAGTPGIDNTLMWTASHVAVADVTIPVVSTNPDGDTVNCSWPIDINCVDPVIVNVVSVGNVGITIGGTPDCTYIVRITNHNTGAVTDYDVTIGADGTGTLAIVVQPDIWIEVGQNVLPFTATDSTFTVPTLGEWGLIAMITLLMGTALVFLRKRRLA
jgi:hypothetical protein